MTPEHLLAESIEMGTTGLWLEPLAIHVFLIMEKYGK